MSESAITRSALSWLRETDTLTMETLKKAYWERIEVAHTERGRVIVVNASYANPVDHAHEVSVSTHGIVHYCSCGDFQYRDRVCKHMVAVALLIDEGSLDLQSVGCKEDVVARATPQRV